MNETTDDILHDFKEPRSPNPLMKTPSPEPRPLRQFQTALLVMKTQPARIHMLPAVIGLLLVLASLSPSIHAADGNPPERITYQGFLVDGNGDALGGHDAQGNPAPKNYDVVFRIYDSQTGGAQYWVEQQTITVDNGYFSVLLGEGTWQNAPERPPLSEVFSTPGNNASDRFVEITVKGIGPGTPATDVTIQPRLRLLTSPYSFLSKHAVSAARLVNPGATEVVSVSGNNVGINKNSPTTALDVNGTVTATKFEGNGTIPVGGIIMWSGETVPTGWALCDGSLYNNQIQTPDLRNRFIRGTDLAGVKQMGGNDRHSHASQPHKHSVDPPSTQSGYEYPNGTDITVPGGVGSRGDAAADEHTHFTNIPAFDSGSTEVVIDEADNLPRYYTLAFIMRVQ